MKKVLVTLWVTLACLVGTVAHAAAPTGIPMPGLAEEATSDPEKFRSKLIAFGAYKPDTGLVHPPIIGMAIHADLVKHPEAKAFLTEAALADRNVILEGIVRQHGHSLSWPAFLERAQAGQFEIPREAIRAEFWRAYVAQKAGATPVVAAAQAAPAVAPVPTAAVSAASAPTTTATATLDQAPVAQATAGPVLNDKVMQILGGLRDRVDAIKPVDTKAITAEVSKAVGAAQAAADVAGKATLAAEQAASAAQAAGTAASRVDGFDRRLLGTAGDALTAKSKADDAEVSAKAAGKEARKALLFATLAVLIALAGVAVAFAKGRKAKCALMAANEAKTGVRNLTQTVTGLEDQVASVEDRVTAVAEQAGLTVKEVLINRKVLLHDLNHLKPTGRVTHEVTVILVDGQEINYEVTFIHIDGKYVNVEGVHGQTQPVRIDSAPVRLKRAGFKGELFNIVGVTGEEGLPILRQVA